MPNSTKDHNHNCGLGSPGRETLRARTKNHRDLRSHEFFCFFFLRQKKENNSLTLDLKS